MLAAFLLFICGCSSSKVLIPASMMSPLHEMPDKPILDLEALKADADSDTTIKAYVVSLNQCIEYSNECTLLLEEYQR